MHLVRVRLCLTLTSISRHVSAPLSRPTPVIHPLASSSALARLCFRTLPAQPSACSSHQPFVSSCFGAAFALYPPLASSSALVRLRLHAPLGIRLSSPSGVTLALQHLSASCNRPRRSFGVADRQMDVSSLHRCTQHAVYTHARAGSWRTQTSQSAAGNNRM
ncbi:hypothetical protein DFH08DRAFT_442594 [Mycena albidolilacea]|uniref:Uncharacterized protein n=1 Tax=Mycena albidolilacea TaxID=1033008 RepID=A0AAD7AIA7_9AGAR|nr:hypothetical protein DFH08DRAFT_442594 [Mycena albidolilacea]